MDTQYADLQVTLHNAWFRSKEHHPAPFTRAEFLDAKPDQPKRNMGWKANKALLEAHLAQVKQTERKMRGLPLHD